MKKVANQWRKILALSFLGLSLAAQPVLAAEPGTVISTDTKDGKIILYVQSPGEIDSIQCQIGTVPCDQITCQPVTEQAVPVETILLLDNSLSVTDHYRPLISEIMNELVANRISGEVFTVATFSDQITYLQKKCGDYAQLKQAIDGIAYQDQETYLTDVLYGLLTELNEEEESVLRRIVIVSDGVDNKAIGYTKEELYDLLKLHPYPIYTLGCSYKSRSGDNSEALKNMSALSRMTQGESWLLDDVSDPLSVAAAVAAGNDVLRVVIEPPSDVCDGSSKGIRLTLESGGQTYSPSAVTDMPFVDISGEAADPGETVPETEKPEPDETKEDAASRAVNSQSAKRRLYLIIGVATALAAAAILFILVRVLRRKEDEDRFEPAPPDAEPAPLPNREPGGGKGHTEIVSGDYQHTVAVWGEDSRSYTLILSDQTNLARRFEVPFSDAVLIGRNKDECQIALEYEKSVSSRHCEICAKGGQFFVKDLGSTNGTFLNGNRVLTEAELYSGCTLTLGRLKLKVEIH